MPITYKLIHSTFYTSLVTTVLSSVPLHTYFGTIEMQLT